ncbi:MAG: hypothetical protein RLZZ308_15 [Candidatus Parcubacteria bacterium]|jgi:putative endonuclease
MAEHNELGKKGELVAKTFLMKLGFNFVEANYRTKYGEIDLIFKNNNLLHFVEVKTIQVHDCKNIKDLRIRPEDNLTYSKWSKLVKTVEIYHQHRSVSYETRYQVDLACVYINKEKSEARVKLLQNITKE